MTKHFNWAFRSSKDANEKKDVDGLSQCIFEDFTPDEIQRMAEANTILETKIKKLVAVVAWFPGVCAAMFMSLACIMEGYGLVIIANFFASPPFRTKYGCPLYPDTPENQTNCEIPSAWQTGLIDGALCGQIIGLIVGGYCTDRYGYKKTFISAMVSLTCFIFILFFAYSIGMLEAGLVLCGIPWGIFQTLTVSYASDVCPTPIRAYFTMWTNLCWVLGQLLGAGVQRGLIDVNSSLNYKLPFALQWVFPIPIIIAALLSPESPWWLVRQGRTRDAFNAMSKLTWKKYAPEDYSVMNNIATIYETNRIEKERMGDGDGKVGYKECFNGPVNRRRTINCCLVWAIQNACGAALMQFSTYFFLQAGLSDDQAFTFTLIQVNTLQQHFYDLLYFYHRNLADKLIVFIGHCWYCCQLGLSVRRGKTYPVPKWTCAPSDLFDYNRHHFGTSPKQRDQWLCCSLSPLGFHVCIQLHGRSCCLQLGGRASLDTIKVQDNQPGTCVLQPCRIVQWCRHSTHDQPRKRKLGCEECMVLGRHHCLLLAVHTVLCS
jgi:MFS family permease